MVVKRSQNRWLSSVTLLLVISASEALVMIYQVVINSQLVAQVVVMEAALTHMQWMITFMMITGIQGLYTKVSTG